ncbi:hypothetical protein ABC347_02125 [Sphingomonas sp. 1P06PA]|uniref:hypothetical protein n=1 Tax=Sphingomonas sp. 1P06PA TaxID=554121 RepID=UPI0039A5DDD4
MRMTMMPAALAALLLATAPAASQNPGDGSLGRSVARAQDALEREMAAMAITAGRIADDVGRKMDREIAGYRGARTDDRGGSLPRPGRGDEEDAAAERCAVAAEGLAQGARADVTSVEPDGSGWRVGGVVEPSQDRGARGFICGTRLGEVQYVRLSDEG